MKHPKHKHATKLPLLYLGIVDFDSAIYRCAAVHEEDDHGLPSAQNTLNDFVMNDIVERTRCQKYVFITTGPENFRREIAVTKAYKGHRQVEKPQHYQALFEWAILKYNCLISENMEADDWAVNLHQKYQGSSVLLGIDKDNIQSAGWHYNYVTNKPFFITPAEAQWSLAYQMLAGDPGDNIQGLYRIGDAKAQAFLDEGDKLEVPPMATVWKVYKQLGHTWEFYKEQYRLLYMLRDTMIDFESSFVELKPFNPYEDSDEDGFIGIDL